MRIYSIIENNDNDEPVITCIFTSSENLPKDETIYYTDKEAINIYDFDESWKIYSGELEEIYNAVKVGDKYLNYDDIVAEKLPEEYTYTETITRVDWDKLGDCPRGILYGVYKEGKKIDTKFYED